MTFMKANESLATKVSGTGVPRFGVGQDLGKDCEMTANLREMGIPLTILVNEIECRRTLREKLCCGEVDSSASEN